ncbi:hypothetical protein D3C77_207850 [compost metagenome]
MVTVAVLRRDPDAVDNDNHDVLLGFDQCGIDDTQTVKVPLRRGPTRITLVEQRAIATVLDGFQDIRQEGRLAFPAARGDQNRVVPPVLDDVELAWPGSIVLTLQVRLIEANQG